MRFEDHPAEQWIPVRYIRVEVSCDFCRFPILAGSPGSTTGSRGTRAWWNRHRNVYECLGCRTEAMRAQSARDAQAQAKHAQQAVQLQLGAA